MAGNPFSSLTQPDFLTLWQKLLPRGKAWPRDPGATLTAYGNAVADVQFDVHSGAVDLVDRELDIAQTILLLPEWNQQYGLPDPCTPPGATIQQQQAALVAKEAAQGGQCASYFIGVAAALGYTITISLFSVAQIGITTMGQPMNGIAWRYTWQVNGPLNTVTPGRIGLSAIGEPMATWGNSPLQCRLAAIAPAETVLLFVYT